MLAYINFATQQNIVSVKLSLKQISQSIHQAKNMATNGYDKDNTNQSIGIYFDLGTPDTLTFYQFNHGSGVTLDSENIYKQEKFAPWVSLYSLAIWDVPLPNVMIHFSAIDGKPIWYTFWTTQTWLDDFEKLDFEITYWDIKNFPFLRKLSYYKDTNVVDY